MGRNLRSLPVTIASFRSLDPLIVKAAGGFRARCGASVGLGGEDAVRDPDEGAALGVGDVVRSAAAVALGGVDPAVESPSEIARHRVGVAEAEPGENGLALVGRAVAVGVAQPE